MGNERKTFQSFKTYADTEPIVTQLTDEEAGRIFKACYGCYFRGETLEFRPGDDRLFRGAWGTFEMKLLAEQKKDSETSEKRSSAGRQGGLANAKEDKQVLANAKGDKQVLANAKGDKQKQAIVPTYTNTGTGTNSSTVTISSTVTNTEQANAVSADLLTSSAAAENAEPSVGDLFSLTQIKKKVKSGKVDLSEEGVKAFYEQMQDDDWMLYGKPVEKKHILRVLREWARKHPEYMLEEENPKKKVPDYLKYFKSWLRYHGYDANYENGLGDFDEEIAINENIIQVIWDVGDIKEATYNINIRIIDSECSSVEELKKTMQLLYSMFNKEKEENEKQ